MVKNFYEVDLENYQKVFVAVGVIVLAAVVKLALSGYELQVSGIKNQVIEIRFDRTNKVRYDEMVTLLHEAGRYKADTADVEINHVLFLP